jgi:hypothetical protein
MPRTPVFLSTFEYGEVDEDRAHQINEMAYLNYMTSRLRAALSTWAIHSRKECAQWWLDGLRNEMVIKFYRKLSLFNY